MYWMSTSQESTSAGGADGVDIVVIENDPGVGETVNVGSGDLIGTVETDIIPTLKFRDDR